jgi:polyphenol oxidase
VVRSADCAPVALLAPEAVGVVHAGWRGLLAGVVETAVAALRALGAGPVEARIGPCISPAAYEFGAADLDAVAERYGEAVRARTPEGRPALHLAAGVTAALRGAGVSRVEGPVGCTATDPGRWFSHRARGDEGRLGTFAWLEGSPGGDGPTPSRPALR